MKFSTLLTESLDKPVEFYLTSDSKVPSLLYYRFTINNMDYAAIVILSNKKGLYKINIGSLGTGSYLKLWKVFPKDLRPLMATLPGIVNHAIETLGPRVNGFAIRIPNKAKNMHLQLLARIAKRFFPADMKVLNVNTPEDDAQYKWSFIARKQKNIRAVFGSKEFAAYDFNDFSEVPLKALEDLEDKRIFKKSNLSDKPLQYKKKYDINLEQERAREFILNSEIPKVIKLDKEEEEVVVVPEISKQMDDKLGDIAGGYNVANKLTASYIIVGLKTNENIEKFEKMNYYDKWMTINKGFSEEVMGELQMAGGKAGIYSYEAAKAWRDYKKSLGIDSYSTKKDIKAFVDKFMLDFEAMKTFAKKEPQNDNWQAESYGKLIETKISNKTDLTYDIPYDPLVLSNFHDTAYDTRKAMIEYDSQNIKILRDMTYEGKYEDITKMKQFRSVKRFSGSTYTSINPISRDLYKALKDNDIELFQRAVTRANWTDSDSGILNGDHFNNIRDVFEAVPPLDRDILVYRGTSQPPEDEVFEDGLYVDPGYISTSASAKTAYDWKDNNGFFNFLIIKVKAGSKIIPLNGKSAHPGENEYLLPAMSILKINKIQQYKNTSTLRGRFIYCEYTGNAHNSLFKVAAETFPDLAKGTIFDRGVDKNQ